MTKSFANILTVAKCQNKLIDLNDAKIKETIKLDGLYLFACLCYKLVQLFLLYIFLFRFASGQSKMVASQLVPARFLCLTSHLVVTITILWSRVSHK